MPKGLTFGGTGTAIYGFISRSSIYQGAIATATGLTPGDIPRAGLPVPWRLQDLLQAGELKRVVVVLQDGLNKRTSRTLYIAKENIPTFRLSSTAGGLIGAILAGKTIISASIPRKASFRLP